MTTSTVYVVANMTSEMRSMVKSIRYRLPGHNVVAVKVRDIHTIPQYGTILPLSDLSDSKHKLEEEEWVNWVGKLFTPKRNVLLHTREIIRYTTLKSYVADMRSMCIPGTVVFTRTNRPDWNRLYKTIRQGEHGKLRTVYLKRSMRSTGRGHCRTRTWASRGGGHQKNASASVYIESTIDSSPSAVVIGQPYITPFTEYRFPIVDHALSREVLRCYPKKIRRMAHDMFHRLMKIMDSSVDFSPPKLWRMDLVWYDGCLFLNEIESIGAENKYGPSHDLTQFALDAYVDTIENADQASVQSINIEHV